MGLVLILQAGSALGATPGDLTGDQQVDLRDALKVLQIVEGRMAGTAADRAAGDVFPNPGIDGRAVGDGQLTREDAELLLRRAVGLISTASLQGTAGLTITPVRAEVTIGTNQVFTATPLDGGPVDWIVEAGPGSIRADGLYAAPAELSDPPIAVIRGTSRRNPKLTGFAAVILVPKESARISREQAIATVQREVISRLPRPDRALALGLPQPLFPTDSLRPAFPSPQSGGDTAAEAKRDGECWFFMVDEDPLSLWVHPVRYVFVDRKTGAVVAEETQSWFPVLNGVPFWNQSETVVNSPDQVHVGVQVVDELTRTNGTVTVAPAHVRPADNVPETMFAPVPHGCECATSSRRFALIGVMSPEEKRVVTSGELLRKEFAGSGFSTKLIQPRLKQDFVNAMVPYRTELRPCDVLVLVLLGHGAAGSCGAVNAGDVADQFELIPTNAKYFILEACDAGLAPELFNDQAQFGLVPRTEILTASGKGGSSPIFIFGEGTGFTSALRSCFGRVDRLEQVPDCMTSVSEIKSTLALRIRLSGPLFERVGSPDSDLDGMLDGREARLGTSPVDPDSDDDGVCDSIEWSRFGDPSPRPLELIYPFSSPEEVPMPRARVGSSYSVRFLNNGGRRTVVQPGAAGENNPYGAAPATGWTVIPPDQPPPGLALVQPTGVLEGTPTQTGRFSFTVQYMDVFGARVSQRVRVDVYQDGMIQGATITVNSAKDNNSRDNELTLREAILLGRGLLLKSALAKRDPQTGEPGEEDQVNGIPGIDAFDRIVVDSSISRIQLNPDPLPLFLLDAPGDVIEAGNLVAPSTPVFIVNGNGVSLTATLLIEGNDPDPVLLLEGEHNSFTGSITNAGGTGILITGDHNRVTASVENAVGTAILLRGCSGNQINGRRSSGSVLHGNGEGIRLSEAASGNSVGILPGNARGRIQITGSRSNAVVVTEQSNANVFNQLDLGTAAQPNGGHGFFIAQGSGNQILQLSAFGNAGSAVAVEGASSRGNVFQSVQASFSENGVMFSGGATSNRVEGGVLNDNRRHGILITGAETRQNLVNFTTIRANAGDGVRIEAGANQNVIGLPTGTREIQQCANGIVVTGAATADNYFGSFIHIADCVQAGLLFSDGARRNRFEHGSFRRCGLGVQFDGTATDDNLVLDVIVSEHQSDGVRFSGGCQFNQITGAESSDSTQSRFRTTWIGKNKGNGITMMGAETAGNFVIRSIIGAHTLPLGPGADEGHAIEVRDGASDNFFIDCVVADHRLSGVRLHGTETRGNRFDDLLVFGNRASSGHGIVLEAGAQENVFLRGEVGPNGGDGVRIAGANTSGNVLAGLLIGVGKIEVPLFRSFSTKRTINGILQLQLLTNSGSGIHIENASSNIIGSLTGPGNSIANNGLDGVRMTGPQSTGNRVIGNFIGTDDTGTQKLPNALTGVLVDGQAHDNEIGGVRAVRNPLSPNLLLPPDASRLGGGNLIAANALSGIRVAGSQTDRNRVQGNVIGWNVGTQSLGNGGDGLTVTDDASGTCIGNCFGLAVSDPGLANVIRRNTGAGVLLVGPQTAGNTLAQNVITENGGADILLVDGANGGVAAPTLNSFSSVTGRLVGSAPGPGVVEVFAANDGAFYASAKVSASPFTLDILNPAASVNAVLLDLGRPPRPGAAKISYTADTTGNSSEFSRRVGAASQEPDGGSWASGGGRARNSVRLAAEGTARYQWQIPEAGLRVGSAAQAVLEGRAFQNVGGLLFDVAYDASRLSLESVQFDSVGGDNPLAATLPEVLPIRAGAIRVAGLFPNGRNGDRPLARLVFRAPMGSAAGNAFVRIEPISAITTNLESIIVGETTGTIVVIAAPSGVTFGDFQRRHWPDGTPDSIKGPTADPDGDELNNLVEYGLHLDPTVSSRVGLPQVKFVSAEGATFGALAYSRPIMASDILYRVLAASSVNSSSWEELSAVVERQEQGDRETIVIRDSRPAEREPQRYYLLQMSLR